MTEVILVCGKICCGKTTYAHKLRKQRRAVLLSMDEVMLTLMDEQLGEMHDVYAKRTETYLLRKSLEILETGIPVILDWGPWTRNGREKLKAFYAEHGIDCRIHALRVDEAEWLKRIEGRNMAIDRGEYQAYHIDEGLQAKFESLYEEPSDDEVDLWIDG